MNLAIIGTGALASLFATRLAPLADVTMAGTWAAQLAAIRDQGLTLVSPDGRRRTVSVPVTEDPGRAAPADVALILVKSYQTERAAHFAAAALAPAGFALTLQNGLGNVETLAATLGPARALAGTTSEGATMLRPGVVRHAGRGLTYLARPAGEPQAVAALAVLFEEAGFVTHLTGDVQGLLWGKLAVNAGINPLTALLEVPNGFLAENAHARALMEAAAREVATLAQMRHISLPYDDAARRTYEVAVATAANRSSMLQDVQNGRPTELEAITGAVVRLAREHDLSVPANAALLMLLRQKLAGAAWPPPLAALPSSLRPHFAALLPAPGEAGKKGSRK